MGERPATARLMAHIRNNAIAYIALFVALGGTSYAAAKIGSSEIETGAIHSRHIKNGDVRARDIGVGAVRSAQVADGSLRGRDLKRGTIPRPPGPGTLQLVKPAVADCASHAGSFCAGWQSYGGQWPKVAYRKDSLGRVYLSGLAEVPNSAGDTVFYLPPGYRPADGSHNFTVSQCNGPPVPIYVGVDGSVETSSTCVWLDGISVHP